MPSDLLQSYKNGKFNRNTIRGIVDKFKNELKTAYNTVYGGDSLSPENFDRLLGLASFSGGIKGVPGGATGRQILRGVKTMKVPFSVGDPTSGKYKFGTGQFPFEDLIDKVVKQKRRVGKRMMRNPNREIIKKFESLRDFKDTLIARRYNLRQTPKTTSLTRDIDMDVLKNIPYGQAESTGFLPSKSGGYISPDIVSNTETFAPKVPITMDDVLDFFQYLEKGIKPRSR